MARTVAGGMLLATPLTLLVLPVLYVMLDGWHRRRKVMLLKGKRNGENGS